MARSPSPDRTTTSAGASSRSCNCPRSGTPARTRPRGDIDQCLRTRRGGSPLLNLGSLSSAPARGLAPAQRTAVPATMPSTVAADLKTAKPRRLICADAASARCSVHIRHMAQAVLGDPPEPRRGAPALPSGTAFGQVTRSALCRHAKALIWVPERSPRPDNDEATRQDRLPPGSQNRTKATQLT